MAAGHRFRAEIRPSGRGGGHLVEVPGDVVRSMGEKGRIPVRATFNGVPYRGSVVRMGGSFVLGVQKAIMAQAGVEAGAELEVVVELDRAPREVEVPEDLARELGRRAALRAAWEACPSPTSVSTWRPSPRPRSRRPGIGASRRPCRP